MDRVLTVFPDCSDQGRWISLASNRWPREQGSVHGATFKPVRGGMPTFGSSLEPDQIRDVAAYERIRFGGATGPDCGCG